MLFSEPLVGKAIIWIRSRIVRADKSVVSKNAPSVQNGTVVPVRPFGASPTTSSLVWGTPPLANSMRCRLPSRSTSTEAGGESVDHRDAHAVQSAGHLVALAAELAAAVELRERDLDARHLLRLVDVDGDAAAVVDHPAAAVGQQGDVDARGVAGHRLVDGVVDHLPHAVVQAGRAGGADVHARALANRVEALQYLDVVGRVGTG